MERVSKRCAWRRHTAHRCAARQLMFDDGSANETQGVVPRLDAPSDSAAGAIRIA